MAHITPLDAHRDSSSAAALATAGSAGSPYSARTTSLRVPAEGTPGAPLPCSLHLRYEGDRPCLDPVLTLLSPSAAIIAESVRISGRAAAADRVDAGVLVRVPPLRPGDTLEVECSLVIPLGLDDATTVPIEALLTAHGGSLRVKEHIVVRSAPRVDADTVAFDLEGPDYLIHGEERTLHLGIHNAGTAIAREVRLEVLDLHDLDCEQLTFVGVIPAGDTRVVPLRICAHGSRPRLSLRLHHDSGMVDLPQYVCETRLGPLVRGTIVRDGNLPLADAPQRFPIRVALSNDGDAPALAPVVHLHLPKSLTLADRPEPIVRFPRIEAGDSEERTVLLGFTNGDLPDQCEIRAFVDLGDERLELEPLAIGMAHVASVVVHRFELPALTAGERATTTLALLSDGNSAIDQLRIQLVFGNGLLYDGDLRVNALPAPDEQLRADGTIILESIPAGTLVTIDFATRALHATVRGTTTAIMAHLEWGENLVTASTAPVVVAPGAIAARTLDELPFRIVGLRAVASSIVAAVDDTTLAEQPEPPQAAQEAPSAATPDVADRSTEMEEATIPAASVPDLTPDLLKVTRQRLAFAVSSNTTLGSLIIALGALADLGSHPPTETYRRAVASLRSLTGVLLSGRSLSSEQSATLRTVLNDYAQTDPEHEVTLLGGLAAIAHEIADSERPEPWWPRIQEFGSAARSLLESAEREAPSGDEAPSDLPALADARTIVAQVAAHVPMGA